MHHEMLKGVYPLYFKKTCKAILYSTCTEIFFILIHLRFLGVPSQTSNPLLLSLGPYSILFHEIFY